MNEQRTYWHLQERRRVPSTYEIATSQLHYYRTHGGLSVDSPVKAWYKRYQEGSLFVCENFEGFADPRATTYTRYVDLQKRKEAFVEQLFSLMMRTNYDATLKEPWLVTLDEILPQLRYLFHGLQMVAAYVGQMAPSSQISIAAALQAADEMRRIQTIAYRTRLLQRTHANFAVRSKARWQEDALWQPLRRLCEELLVTYDWGEAFIALNLVIKPLVDQLFHGTLAATARQEDDGQLANILEALAEDCRWHQQWSEALLRHVASVTPATIATVRQWADKWYARTAEAIGGFAPLLTPYQPPASFAVFMSELAERCFAGRHEHGLP